MPRLPIPPAAVLRTLPVALGLLLAPGCQGDGSKSQAPETVGVAVEPRKAEITAGEEVRFGAVVSGTVEQGVYWAVMEPGGGEVSPEGLFLAPPQAGVYHVLAQSKVAARAKDVAEITVHPRAEVVAFKADSPRVRAGDTVTLTPEFTGGQGRILPGSVAVTSGIPVGFTPDGTTAYTLVVTNPLGRTATRKLQVEVVPAAHALPDISAPRVVRAGNLHVAVFNRANAKVAWQSDDVEFMGNGDRPGTHVVLFRPKDRISTYRLTVKAQGVAGESPDAPGAASARLERSFTFQGKVEAGSGADPVLLVDPPFVTRGKTCRVRVASPRTGAAYRWTVKNGAASGSGPEVTVTAGDASHLLVTCEDGPHATTAGLLVLDPPDPPVIRAGETTVAGAPQGAFVTEPQAGITYRWELDPAQGRFTGNPAAAGPMVTFSVARPGPFTLRCHAVNLAGDVSAPTLLVLTAVPYALEPPRLRVPALVRAGSGPHAAEVFDPVAGQTYVWTALGADLASPDGARVTFTPTQDHVLLTCTARNPVTGTASASAAACGIVQPIAEPVILAPATVAPSTSHVAGVLNGGRPGETYAWTLAPGGTLSQATGTAVAFTSGAAQGPFVLTCVAANALGDRSATVTFTGQVSVPAGPAGGGAPPQVGGVPAGPGTAPGAGTTQAPATTPAPGTTPGAGAPIRLRVAYASMTFRKHVPVPVQAPLLTNAVLPIARFELRGALPSGLTWDPATGEISGVPDTVQFANFFVAVVDGAGNRAESDPVTFAVSDDAVLGLSYGGPGPLLCDTRVRLADRVPAVANAAPLFGLAYALNGDLPPGLHLDPATGAITGVPRVPGAFRFQVTVRNWDRTASADLAYQVNPGPVMTLRYDDFHFDDTHAVERRPALANPDPEAHAYRYGALTALPPGLDLDPATGVITGTVTAPGAYTFTVGVASLHPDTGAELDTAVSSPVTYTVAPFVPLGALALSASVNPLPHDQDLSRLSWTFAGLPREVTLTRNLLVKPAGGASSPDLDPDIPLAPGATGADVTVTRRQAYTLTLKDRVGRPDVTATLSLAKRSLEVVAGNPDMAIPAPEYQDTPPGSTREGRWRNVKGLVAFGGSVLVSEGEDATLRRIDVATGRVERMAGSFRLPDHGATPHRLSDPGPMAVYGTDLLICDTGSHTLKVMPLDGTAPPAVLAGQPGVAAPAPAPLPPPTPTNPGLPAQPVTPFANTPFGTLTAIAVQGRFAFLADLEHGVRVLDLVARQARLLAPASAPYNHPAWQNALMPRLKRPVAVAAARILLPAPVNAHRWFLFVTTETAPQWDTASTADSRERNGVIQVLASDRDDPINAAWTLAPFAGRLKAGLEDGDVDPADVVGRGPMFRSPVGLWVEGNRLLLADRDNHCIRAVDLVPAAASGLVAGAVRTVAGNIVRGTVNLGLYDNADPMLARFKRPTQLAAGPTPGIFWVADQEGHMVRKVGLGPHAGVSSLGVPWTAAAPDGEKSLVDDPKGHHARFRGPRGVAVEQSTGDAFVVDGANHSLRRVTLRAQGYTPAGAVSTFAGNPSAKAVQRRPMPLKEARFQAPTEIAMDGYARMFVLEDGGTRIKVIDRGNVTNFLDPVRGGAGVRIAARSGGSLPVPVAGPRHGADGLVAFSNSLGGPLPAPRPGSEPPPRAHAALAAYDHGNTDAGPWRITLCRITGELTPTAPITLETVVDGLPTGPQALAIGRDGRIHVVVPHRDRDICAVHAYREGVPGGGNWQPDGPVFEFGPGVPADVPGAAHATEGGFPEISGAAVDSRGNLFLADAANGVVWVLREGSRAFGCAAGAPGVNRLVGAPASQALTTPLLEPRGLAVTPEDDLVVTCGDAVVQITAPLLPYREALPNGAWRTQAAHNLRAGSGGGGGRPAPAPRPETMQESLANRAYNRGLALRTTNPASALKELENSLRIGAGIPGWVHYRDAIQAAMPLWVSEGDLAAAAGNPDPALEHYRKFVKFARTPRVTADALAMARIRPLVGTGLLALAARVRAADPDTARECYQEYLAIPGLPNRAAVQADLASLP